MAKRSFSNAGTAWAAIADTTALTANQYMDMVGGAATQLVNIMEVYIGGQAAASTISNFLLARESSIGTGGLSAVATPFADGPLGNLTTALGTTVPVAHSYVTLQPQRSAVVTLGRLNLSCNTFGGIVKWTAAPGEEWQILGSIATSVSTCLSCTTASGGQTGIAGAHMIYEPF